jgi:CheY-like chemotaxis protein
MVKGVFRFSGGCSLTARRKRRKRELSEVLASSVLLHTGYSVHHMPEPFTTSSVFSSDPKPVEFVPDTVGAALSIRSILLLDDDLELADTLKALIETRNYVVTLAHNGVEGLREVMQMDFDVILCDMMMPTMPGEMFYLAVQKVKPHLCKRFLFVTGHGDSPRVNDFLQRTDGLALFKPVPVDELLQMISLVIQRTERDGVGVG